MDRLVFVSDQSHLPSGIPGGVQVCTAEYLRLLEQAGFQLEMYPVRSTRRVLPRIKARLGLNTYDGYDFAAMFPDLRACIERTDAKVVSMNQIALAGFAPLIKEAYGNAVKTVVLSHGNESGDFLYAVTIAPRPNSALLLARDIYKLGSLLRQESLVFSAYIDLILVMTRTELEINRWLGVRRAMVVPRTFSPEDIGWTPVLGRVGFVGTLDHPPNAEGLGAVLLRLRDWGSGTRRVRVAGAPYARGEALAREFGFVDYLGPLPENELKQEVASWALFLNPVFWYSRGASTKLAMGINWGIPVISTPAGNRGYEWRAGNVLLVENSLEMANAIREVSESKERLAELAEGTRRASASGPELGRLAQELRDALA